MNLCGQRLKAEVPVLTRSIKWPTQAHSWISPIHLRYSVQGAVKRAVIGQKGDHFVQILIPNEATLQTFVEYFWQILIHWHKVCSYLTESCRKQIFLKYMYLSLITLRDLAGEIQLYKNTKDNSNMH
jgi:hypothetical protein